MKYRYIASTTDPGPTTWRVISTLRRIQVSNAKIAVPSVTAYSGTDLRLAQLSQRRKASITT
ncbi:hypothetical protein V1478_009491 [Vespula squamosa]|uniref:Uncharacterized protein n=1 Tax=Vespula squamosa TaxID=30214 RepID=A0ABD2APT6_VESSQ